MGIPFVLADNSKRYLRLRRIRAPIIVSLRPNNKSRRITFYWHRKHNHFSFSLRQPIMRRPERFTLTECVLCHACTNTHDLRSAHRQTAQKHNAEMTATIRPTWRYFRQTFFRHTWPTALRLLLVAIGKCNGCLAPNRRPTHWNAHLTHGHTISHISADKHLGCCEPADRPYTIKTANSAKISSRTNTHTHSRMAYGVPVPREH